MLPTRRTTQPAQVSAWLVAVVVVSLVIPLDSALAANPFFLEAHGVPMPVWLLVSLAGTALTWAVLTGILALLRRILPPLGFDLVATALMVVVSVFFLANAIAASGALDAVPLAGWLVGATFGFAVTWLSRWAAFGVAALLISSLVAAVPVIVAIVGGGSTPPHAQVSFDADANRPSIVWVIADELQYPLVFDGQGRARDAFPNLQALQKDSTTYSRAYTAANLTEVAVPAILSGVADVAALDVKGREHLTGDLGIMPALSDEYSVVWDSPVFASACARLPCVNDAKGASGSWTHRAATFAADVVAIVGRTALAGGIRDAFPAIDGRWREIWGGDADLDAVPNVLAGIERAKGEQPNNPFLAFWHTLGTHAPWVADFSGAQIYPYRFYAVPDAALVGRSSGGYLTTPELVSLERRLYAASAVDFDRQLGELIAGLKRSGRYDDTMIVLTADHGTVVAEDSAPFISGHDQRRVGETSQQRWTQVAHVPLVVKEPGQRGAEVVTTPRSTGQIARTVLDIAGARASAIGDAAPAPSLADSLPSGPVFTDLIGGVKGWPYEAFPAAVDWPADDQQPADPQHPFAIGIAPALLGSTVPDGYARIDDAAVDELPGKSVQSLLVTSRPVGACDADSGVGLVTRDDRVVGSVLWEDTGDANAAERGWAIVPRGPGALGIWCATA